ncbi:MAG: M14 family zinc carboxypeptidase [Peptostreptococcaceae bacterium]
MKKSIFIFILIIMAISIINISYAEVILENKAEDYGLTSYDDMVSELKNLEKSSEHIKLEIIGKSVNKKDIYLVKLGKYNPQNPTILILTQQHGNEGLPTQSALNFIKKLSKNNKNNKFLIHNVNILIIPRLNVDGAEGVDGVPIRFNYNQVDLNRDHFSKTQPETQALHYNVLRKYKIDYMIDFHQRNERGISMLYPTNQGVKFEIRENSKKLGAIVYQSLKNHKWVEISEYHGGSKNIIARNEVACEYDIATLLLEVEGIIDYYDNNFVFDKKKNKKIIKECEYIMLNLVDSIATNEIERADTSIWNKLYKKVNIFI